MLRTRLRSTSKNSVMERALNHIAAAWHSRTILAKLFSFASIGVLNVAVDVTVFSIAYKLFDLPLVVSNIIAWSVAVSGSYAMNTKLTFGLETRGALSWKQYIGFAASGALGLVFATTTLVILSQYANVFVAKFVSIVAAFGVNFSMSHFVVFRDMPSERKVAPANRSTAPKPPDRRIGSPLRRCGEAVILPLRLVRWRNSTGRANA